MHEGLPENFDFCEQNSVIVLDDLMEESKDSVAVTALYTKAAYHRPYFIINILQNLYFQSKQQRSRHLNTQYMVIFKIPRDENQIAVLSHQMYPNKRIIWWTFTMRRYRSRIAICLLICMQRHRG